MSDNLKNVYIARLFDCYGEMLSQKQKILIDCYYNQDFSLSEIAENEGITRQGVSDSLKRAESILISCEENLGLCKKFDELKSIANNASDLQGLCKLKEYIDNL